MKANTTESKQAEGVEEGATTRDNVSNNSSSGLPLLLLPLQPPPGLQKPVPGPPGPPRDSSQSIVQYVYVYTYIYIYIYTVLTAYQDENQDD